MKNWWEKSVVYQIYPKSFCDSDGDGIGDLNGIRAKLCYLKELGVDAIWLSPVYPSPNVDNGYDISDYYDISPDYGTLDDMKALIKEAGEMGIRIVMDLVVNHTSDQHKYFQDARKSKDSPYRDFYIWRKGNPDGTPPNGLRSFWGGSAWEYTEETGEYYLHFFSKGQPDLNWENPQVRENVYKMMNFWIGLGVAGFRMDVIDMIGKVPDEGICSNGPRLHEFIHEMNRKTFGEKGLLTVGECGGAEPELGLLYSDPAREELSMIFQFEHVALDQQPGKEKWELMPLKLTDLKRVFTAWQEALGGRGWNTLFWDNHDQPRVVSRWGDEGKYRVESAKMLATLLHGMKGTPYIYQGEEIGMTNIPFESLDDFDDIESINMYRDRIAGGYSEADIMDSLRAKSRDNARTCMQWDSSPNGGFTTGTPWYRVNPNYTEINVEKSLEDKNSIFYHYQSLIRLRKENPILSEGIYELLLPDDEKVYAYLRTLGGQKWLIVCNFYGTRTGFSYPASGKCILSNYPQPDIRELQDITLEPYEATIYELD